MTELRNLFRFCDDSRGFWVPHAERLSCSADFQVCRVAGFQARPPDADLEIGGTAVLENCATPDRSADFQVCRVAGFQACGEGATARSADLEIGGTAGLETCATGRGGFL